LQPVKLMMIGGVTDMAVQLPATKFMLIKIV